MSNNYSDLCLFTKNASFSSNQFNVLAYRSIKLRNKLNHVQEN